MLRRVIFILFLSFVFLGYNSTSSAITEGDIVKKYFDLLREVNNLYQEIKQEKEEKVKEEIAVKQQSAEEVKKEEVKKEEPQGLYTVKYNIEFVKDFIEKDLKKLLHDEQAQAIFFEDGSIEITDVSAGHKRVQEYISNLKEKYLKIYSYEIHINGDKKYSGTVSPVLPSNFSKGGVITCLPKGEFLLVNVTDYFGGLQAKFMVSLVGGQYEFLNGKEHVKVILKETMVTTANK